MLTWPQVIISCFKPSSKAPGTSTLPPNTAPTHLAHSIAFDLYVARGSLLLDMISDTLIALHLSPSPLVFTGVSSISALASGTTPALHSLAICILQRSSQGNPDIGALFSGMSTLSALGQAILAVSPASFSPLLCWRSDSLLAAADIWLRLLEYCRPFPAGSLCASSRTRARGLHRDILRTTGASPRQEGQSTRCCRPGTSSRASGRLGTRALARGQAHRRPRAHTGTLACA